MDQIDLLPPLGIISDLAGRPVSRDDHLDQIGLDGLQMRYCLPCLLEEQLDFPMFKDAEIQGWETVSDVLDAVQIAQM